MSNSNSDIINAILSGINVLSISELIDILYTIEIPKLTKEDIETKNFTYVTAYVRGVVDSNFLVASRFKKQARVLAKQYIKQQGWKCKKFDLMPSNHIMDARRLYREGKYL